MSIVMATTKLRILTFLNYYLPGYEAGGPIRTLANMVQHLGDDFEFYIITRDRDINDKICYSNIKRDQWQPVGKASVFYVSPKNETISYYKKLMLETPHDVLYLNSFFDADYTVKPLIARRLLSSKNRSSLIVAPRGEFSSAALQLKSIKKRIFIWMAKSIRLYADATFQASSPYEAADIEREFDIPLTDIHVAIDLPENLGGPVATSTAKDLSHIDEASLRIIYLSRISPMKNLTFALEILSNVRSKVRFDIYGPVPDEKYWAQCRALFARLPSNVTAQYLGSVPPSQVSETFSAYDVLFLPTLGENYGHVIAESLAVGTRVLISDRTPWRDLESDGLGWDISLDQPEAFRARIDMLGAQTGRERYDVRESVCRNAANRLLLSNALKANRQLFLRRGAGAISPYPDSHATL